MKSLIFSLIALWGAFSCASDGPGLAPPSQSFLLLNPDSSSVITSGSDKIVVDYKDNRDGSLHRSYSACIKAYFQSEPAPWIVNDTLYVLHLGQTEGDSVFIACKGQTDTLVQRFEAPQIVFNGKEIDERADKEGIIPLVRQY